MMKNPVYLVVLSGGGDTTRTLVSQAVWDWILSPYVSDKSSYREEMPPEVAAESKDESKSVYLTRGSYENDRAMYAPGKSFYSTKKLTQYLTENNLVIEEEFEGYIY